MTDLQQEITKASSKAATSRKTARRIQLWLLVTATLLAISVSVIIVLLHNAENRADVSGAQVVTEQAEKKEIASQAQQALCQEGDKLVFDRELCEY
jgi:Na+/H+-dicarboxylate symporter